MSSPRYVCDAEGTVAALLTDGAQAMKIDWKDESKNLTKLHPRVADPDDSDDLPAEGGSFFNFFEVASDPFEVRGAAGGRANGALTDACTDRRVDCERRIPRGD